jgi:hypothetical protein
MTEVQVVATVGHSLTVAQAGERYQRHLKRAGRKRSTIAAVESALRVQLVPFFADKALDTIRHEDVVDLVAVLEGKGLSPKSIHNYVGTLSALFNFAKGAAASLGGREPVRGRRAAGRPGERRDPVPGRERVGGRAAPRPAGRVSGARPGVLPRRDHGGTEARRADRAALARR